MSCAFVDIFRKDGKKIFQKISMPLSNIIQCQKSLTSQIQQKNYKIISDGGRLKIHDHQHIRGSRLEEKLGDGMLFPEKLTTNYKII